MINGAAKKALSYKTFEHITAEETRMAQLISGSEQCEGEKTTTRTALRDASVQSFLALLGNVAPLRF